VDESDWRINMANERQGLKTELERIHRVSDQMVTMHSALRDEYTTKYCVLDCALFASSIVLVGFVWVDPQLLHWFSDNPSGFRFLIGGLSLATFFLSLVSFRVDWKAKADSHRHAAEVYSQVEIECRHLLNSFDSATDTEIHKLLARYIDLGEVCVKIPESSFLRLKQKHKMKILISKHLDEYPASSIKLFKLRTWWANNFKNVKKYSNQTEPEDGSTDEVEADK